ncbi:MAG: DegT/DnrJ/EryC1/StrS family aminotransferase [Alphaproteobacteria bacterium]
MIDAKLIKFVDLAAQQNLLSGSIQTAMNRVLAHGQYIMGPEVLALENKLKSFNGAAHAITCSSGTDALLMSMLALGIGPGDAVICPDFTYTATPESIAMTGAVPVFVDVHVDTYNIAPSDVEQAVSLARTQGLTAKGIIAVDLFGVPADYGELLALAESLDLFVVCDAAQSFGARYRNKKVGTLGHISTTSFFPAKPLGAYGDGGAVFTQDGTLADTLASLRVHGQAVGGSKYDIQRVGINGRLDTLQAAILLEKLRLFPEEIESRRAVADRYTKALSDKYITPRVPEGIEPVWAQYTLRRKSGSRQHLLNYLKKHGVPTAIYYPRPLHMQSAYRHFPSLTGANSNSTLLCNHVFSIPVHPYLTKDQQNRIIELLDAFEG